MSGSDPAQKISLSLRPIHHLERLPDAEARQCWAAVGVDPQFLVSHQHGPAFASGWYLLRIDLRVREGYLNNPCLYPDYGTGRSDGSRINFPCLADGVGSVVAVVRFDHDVRSLRFDPSVSPCTFELSEISLTRIDKFSAASRMVAKLASRLLRKPSLLRAFVRDAWASFFRAGLPGLGDCLYRMHESRAVGGVPSLDYAAWTEKFDRLTDADLAAIRRGIASLARKPLISVVVPVYDTPEVWLRCCIDSVLAQHYPHWELCIADDASTAPHVAGVLAAYAAQDPRIRVVSRERNGHISEASNSALMLARGEFIALLDHDDELAPHALYLVAKAISERPGLKLIYSDEDKLDKDGVRFDPYFKTDWNPELILGHNMVCHLGVYHTDLVRRVGGFRRGYEGSQDHDLTLRCVSRLQPEEIGHIPHVLYHWRAIEGSTALSGSSKRYAEEAGKRAIEEYLAETGEPRARVEVVVGGYRVRYGLPAVLPKVSLVVPTRDRVDLLRTCIDSIRSLTTYRNYEIVVVDNQSSEPATLDYFATLRDAGNVRVIAYDAPFNYSRMNNHAVRETDGELVALVNNDIEVVEGDWLGEMVSHAIRPQTGAVGAMLYYPDDTIQHAGVIVGLGGVAGHVYVGMPRGYPGQHHRARLTQNLTAVTAACMLVRRSVFDEVGGLDETFEVAFNDIDFCLRVASRGYRSVWTPWAELYHHESATRGYEDSPAKKARFNGEVNRMIERWGEALRWDPAYNPNLGLEGHDFPLSIPPRLPMRDSLRDGRTVLSGQWGADRMERQRHRRS